MSKALFAPGSKVELDGQNAVVSYENDEAFVLFFEGGRQREIPKQVLRLAFNEGRLKYRVDTPHSKLSRFPYLTRSEAKQAQRLLAYLSPMAESTTPGSVATHKAIIAEVVKTSGHEVLPAPKPITLYKWFKKWDASGRNVLALLPSVKGQQRQSRLAPQVVDLLNDAIDQFVLTNKPATVAKAYRSFEKKVQQLELDVKVPSAQTFYNYVNAVHPLERTLKQQGNAVFQEKSLAVTKHYQASYPMERVEFDGVHLTFGLVDEQLNLIAKEVIVFIAMDVYSRAIVGFSYKYGDRVSEDAELVINCVRSVLRQKNADYHHLTNEWFGGKPDIIIGDAGSAIIAESITELAGHYNIRREVTESSQGWKKPHIETFFRTFRNDLMNPLPGYLPKRSPEFKRKVNLKKEACVTVEEFELMLVKYLVDGYNQSSHSSLNNRTPHQKWLEGVANYGEPEMVEDLGFSNLFGGRLQTVGVDPNKGIRLNYRNYHSADLARLYYELKPGKKGNKRPAKIRWSSQDLTKVAVLDEKNRTYLVVPCTSHVPDGMTLEETRRLQKDKPKPVRPDVISDSPQLQNSLNRLKQVQKKHGKKGQTHPSTTPAEALCEEDLLALISSSEEAGDRIQHDGIEQGESLSTVRTEVENYSPQSRGFKFRERD